MAPAMQPAEIQFAQRLASHEKGIRDRAMRKLRQYISVKTQRETGLPGEKRVLPETCERGSSVHSHTSSLPPGLLPSSQALP